MTEKQYEAIETLEKALRECAKLKIAIYARESHLLACNEETHRKIVKVGSAEDYENVDMGTGLNVVRHHGVFKGGGC